MNSLPFAIAIGAAILHIALMEWSYGYHKWMHRKLRTIQRRIKLTETDHD